jgi:spore coat protein H
MKPNTAAPVRPWVVFALWLLAVALLHPCLGAAGPTNALQFFSLTNVWDFHLTISIQDWKAMQPSQPDRSGPRPNGGPGGQGGFAKTEFPCVRAALRFNGQTLEKIGVRFKGNSSYRAADTGYKRPFKLDFNQFDENQKFLGLTQLKLSNNFKDSSQSREALAYDLFRAAGVPCSRTAFVKLYLTIPGELDDRYIGLYTAVEDVGKPFLKSHLGSAKGLLLKPERFRGLPYLGDDWNSYAARLNPKNDVTSQEAARFMAFAQLINNTDTDTFGARIKQILDVDEFLRFVAVNAALANLDSILCTGHNYYLYLEPKSDRFVFIPWDLNEAFAGFQQSQQRVDLALLSIRHPHAGQNLLIERVLAIPEFDRLYRQYLADLIAGPLSAQSFEARLKSIERACQESVNEEMRSGFPLRSASAFGRGPRQMGAPDLRQFRARRVESMTGQLAGKSEGVVIEMRPGPPLFRQGPGPRPEPPQ